MEISEFRKANFKWLCEAQGMIKNLKISKSWLLQLFFYKERIRNIIVQVCLITLLLKIISFSLKSKDKFYLHHSLRNLYNPDGNILTGELKWLKKLSWKLSLNRKYLNLKRLNIRSVIFWLVSNLYWFEQLKRFIFSTEEKTW